MGAEGLVEGMTRAFQITTTDNLCLVMNSDASGGGMRPALSPSYASGLNDLLQATKRLLGPVAYTSFGDQLEAETDILAAALGTDEGQARLAARLSSAKLGNKDRQGR